jgi:adenine-specific DNA-methyltransferase
MVELRVCRTYRFRQKSLREVLPEISGLDATMTLKPLLLLERVLQIATQHDSIILDSFAGSATTAHAVIAQNAKDGGNCQFILVECEDYADSLTAERVRRVNNGYEFEGTQKEELHRQNITWSSFSKDGPRHKVLQHAQSIENIDGLRFDNIKKEIKDGELIVTGEKRVTEKVAGLGGGFTFYTLGEPLDIDNFLTGETQPDYAALGAWLFHTANGQPLNAEPTDAEHWYLGSISQYHVWLIYRPDLDFLKSPQAALTLSMAETIGQAHKDKSHLVFAAAKYVPNRLLLPLGVEYAPLPFALYRIEKD